MDITEQYPEFTFVRVDGHWYDGEKFHNRLCAIAPEVTVRDNIFDVVEDNRVFYVFSPDEPVVGENWEFTITDSRPVTKEDE